MKQQGLVCAISNVSDGNMALKWGEEKEVWRNREKFLSKNGIAIKDCVFTSLVHGTEIKMVDSHDKGKTLEADGFITLDKGVAIWITTGDCLPVVFFDSQKNILGLAHLGWRGVDKGLAGKMVKKLIDLNVDPINTQVWIGPGVRKETYLKYGVGIPNFWKEIPDENKQNWEKFSKMIDGELSLDLVGFVKYQICKLGVREENIEVSEIDTVLDRNYFSQFRSDKLKEPQGRFATVVMMV